MSGMGRTGRNFAVDHFGVAPDILVTAKGLSSGYAPLGAIIVSEKIVDAIAYGSGSFIHGFTYSSHPVSLAAGRAALGYLSRMRMAEAADSDRPDSIASKVKETLAQLEPIAYVGDVRGIGLLWAVEFVADKVSKKPFPPETNFSARVAQSCLERGLLVYPVQGCADGNCGDHILIAPPAVIRPDQISWAGEQLAAVIQESSQVL